MTMAAIPYAFSVHHFISSVGADAGFAAIIGLAILVLLFFTQARDGATLRRRAQDAEEELHSLRSYVSQLSRALEQLRASAAEHQPVRVAPPPAAALTVAPAPSRAAPQPATVPAPAPAFAVAPFAPAGLGAPALSSATRLIPAGAPDEIAIRAGHALAADAAGQPVEDGALAVVGAVAHASGEAVAPSLAERVRMDTIVAPPPFEVDAPGHDHDELGDDHGELPDPEDATGAGDEPVGPPPSTAAGGANGIAHAPQIPDQAERVPQAPPAPPRREPPLGPRRSGGRPAPVPPPRYAKVSTRRRRSRVLAVAAAAAVVVAAIAVAAILVTGGTGSGASGSSSSIQASTSAAARRAAHKSSRTAATATVASAPSAVPVAVLNSTSTAHLASSVMARLAARGYAQGATPTNAPDQPLSSTIVGYTKPAYRADALAVAKALSLGPASVQGVSQSDLGTACPGSGACTVKVVVTVGSDLASGG